MDILSAPEESVMSLLRACLLPTLSAFALAACAGPGATVISGADYHRYSRSDYVYAAGGRDLSVVIRGNPTTSAETTFDRAVVDAMQDTSPLPRANFVLGTTERTRPQYRVALLFGPGGPARADDLCSRLDALVPQTGPTAETRVAAAFCDGGEALSEVQGRTGRLTGPNDPQLAALMRQLTATLLPPENPNRLKEPDARPPVGWLMSR